MLLRNVGRATAAYTRPDYTTRASSFIKKRVFYLNFVGNDGYPKLVELDFFVAANSWSSWRSFEASITRKLYYGFVRFDALSHKAP